MKFRSSQGNTSNPSRAPGKIAAAIERHPPMPALYGKLVSFLRDPDVDFEQLADIVRFDPGVTMNILKVVNSPRFAGTQRIDSLRQAAVRLGTRRLLEIVMAQGIATRLSRPLDGYGLEPRSLLRHSIGVALTAETLVRALGLNEPELLFTAGLLHDMGKIILDPFVQETRAEFDARLRDSSAPFDQLERDVLGMTHAEAGARLMEHWTFPEELSAIVRGHHQPESAGSSKEAALMVHLADTLVYSQGVGDGIDGFRYRVAESAASSLGLRPYDVERVASETLDRIREWEEMMGNGV